MAARPNVLPGAFEHLVLLALMRLGRDAYGMTVRVEIEQRTGRSVSLGAVYATLDRLEQKGWVRSHAGQGARSRGGRARRFVRILAPGERAARRALAAIDRMREQLPDVGLPQGAGA